MSLQENCEFQVEGHKRLFSSLGKRWRNSDAYFIFTLTWNEEEEEEEEEEEKKRENLQFCLICVEFQVMGQLRGYSTNVWGKKRGVYHVTALWPMWSSLNRREKARHQQQRFEVFFPSYLAEVLFITATIVSCFFSSSSCFFGHPLSGWKRIIFNGAVLEDEEEEEVEDVSIHGWCWWCVIVEEDTGMIRALLIPFWSETAKTWKQSLTSVAL